MKPCWNLEAYEQAEVEFKKALDIKHDLPGTHHNLAVLYLKNNHYTDAVIQLKQALKLQPENPTTKNLLDYALRQLKEDPS
jgi:Flp pilus assembly protein TadD